MGQSPSGDQTGPAKSRETASSGGGAEGLWNAQRKYQNVAGGEAAKSGWFGDSKRSREDHCRCSGQTVNSSDQWDFYAPQAAFATLKCLWTKAIGFSSYHFYFY